MDMEQACKQLKAGKLVRFWYCAGDGAGNPLLLLDRKRIPEKTIKEAKGKARKKQFCGGHMTLKKGVLTAFTDDGAPNLFDKNVKLLVGNYITRPSDVAVKPAAEADALLQAEATDTGAQALGRKYIGEDRVSGWRQDFKTMDRLMQDAERALDDPERLKDVARGLGTSADEAQRSIESALESGDEAQLRYLLSRQSGAVTDYFDEEQTLRSKAMIGEDGSVLLGEEPTDRRGFVIDAESGELRTFENKKTVTASGQSKFQHHSSAVQGKDVIGAGHIRVDEGVVKAIDDQSGHYRPDATKTLQAVLHLEKLGAKMVDDALVGEDGAPLNPGTISAALKSRAKTLRLYELARDKANVELAGQGMPQVPYDPSFAAIREELLRAKVWFSNRSAKVELLGKNGATDEEWSRVKGNPGAILALLREKLGDPGMFLRPEELGAISNVQIFNFLVGNRSAVTLSKEQFEQTGGNEAQIRLKAAMNKQLNWAGGSVERASTTRKPNLYDGAYDPEPAPQKPASERNGPAEHEGGAVDASTSGYGSLHRTDANGYGSLHRAEPQEGETSGYGSLHRVEPED